MDKSPHRVLISHAVQQDLQKVGAEGVAVQTGEKAPVTPSENPVTAGALEHWFASTDDKLSKLLLLFQEKIDDDLIKGQLFERLYQELTNYREDFVFKNVTRRIFTDIIRLFDRVDGILKVEFLDQMQRDDLIDHVLSFRDEILQALRRQEVYLVESEPGTFNEVCQEAVDTRLVNLPQEDQKVVEVVRRGFSYKGHLLRAETVIVGKFGGNKEGDNG
jgi:molecular chaperone GrpE (heat shock protein)